jgi:5-methylcytosine-specific restriction endonuclease McrA
MTRIQIPKVMKDRVKARFGGKCGYCGEKTHMLQIDHLKPVANFWHAPYLANYEENLMPACFSCNNYKNTMSIEVFRKELSLQIKRAREGSVNVRLAERFGLIQFIDKPIVFHFEHPKAVKNGGEELWIY